MRDPDSTTYVSSMESIDEFGPQLRQEALRRGLATVAQIVLLIDGAVGLANMGLSCFRTAVQIVDFYHAMQQKSCWRCTAHSQRLKDIRETPIQFDGYSIDLAGCNGIRRAGLEPLANLPLHRSRRLVAAFA
ncbi:MAG: hypothetical protein L0Z50_39470 [Verrucomicrobiales bacterium]|nr:hypothetical protein [Verrucomicrobiales bacterium]